MFIISNNASENRLIFADILRIIAIFAVINIHVTGSFTIANFSATNMNNWWTENIYNSLSRWSVPIFFMVSGMFILNSKKEESLKTFFLKRFKKVIIPFFIWGIIYELIKPRYLGVEFSVNGMINDFISGTIYWHFWFFYAIIVLYLFAPIIKSFVSKANKEILVYAISIWFIFVSVMPLLEFILKIDFNISTEISFIGGCVGYYILGYYLYNFEIGKKIKFIVYTLAIVSLLLTPYLTYYLTKLNNGELNSFFYDYFGVNVILVSIAIFILFKSINWQKLFGKSQKINSFISEMSKASFGIFLVHYIVLNELVRSGLSIFDLQTSSIYRVPITDIAIFAISFIIIFISRKIPIVKNIVP